MPRTTRRAELKGLKFGQLKVTKRHHRDELGVWWWKCKCSCGTVCVVSANRLRAGRRCSCGCGPKGGPKPIHGMERTRTYNVWAQMIQRCTNQNSRMYRDYGARGIAVCDRWRSFVNFFADMGEKPEGLSIDRINNDGNYEPGNCRWITPLAQMRNQRRTKFLTIDGKTKSTSEWCEEYGLSKRVLATRLRWGWDVKKAVRTAKALRRGR